MDAIAYALNLSLAPGKARHARELAHVPIKAERSANDESEELSHEFFVKLNFVRGQNEKLSIQRGLRKKDHGDGYYTEYVVNGDRDRPLLLEDYRQILSSVYNLDMQEFTIYQNQLEDLCFGERSAEKLSTAFENLSGSNSHKEKFEQL